MLSLSLYGKHFQDYVIDPILSKILASSHAAFKEALKTSRLNVAQKERTYLLGLQPKMLCEEFNSKSPLAFRLLVEGIIGITKSEEVFDTQTLMNNVCEVYSTLAKLINKNANGYGLLLTTSARDGGLREDSIKLFASTVHPTTSQRHDNQVLAKGWNDELNNSLKKEKVYYEELHKLKIHYETLGMND